VVELLEYLRGFCCLTLQHSLTLPTKRTKFSASTSGFTPVALEADKMTVRMVDIDGKLLYSTVVPRVPA